MTLFLVEMGYTFSALLDVARQTEVELWVFFKLLRLLTWLW
jgi:hypothetical protein